MGIVTSAMAAATAHRPAPIHAARSYPAVNAGPLAFDNAVRDLGVFNKRWPQALRAMITGHYPLEAFHDPVMGTAGGIKNVISISEAGKP